MPAFPHLQQTKMKGSDAVRAGGVGMVAVGRSGCEHCRAGGEGSGASTDPPTAEPGKQEGSCSQLKVWALLVSGLRDPIFRSRGAGGCRTRA